MAADGFWGPGRGGPYANFRFSPPLPLQMDRLHFHQLIRCTRKKKKRQYSQRICKVEHGSFFLLEFSLTGGMAKEATVFYRRLASLLAEKLEQPYSTTMGWLCCTLCFSLLHSSIQCLRGSRSSRGQPVFYFPLGLIQSESKFLAILLSTFILLHVDFLLYYRKEIVCYVLRVQICSCILRTFLNSVCKDTTALLMYCVQWFECYNFTMTMCSTACSTAHCRTFSTTYCHIECCSYTTVMCSATGFTACCHIVFSSCSHSSPSSVPTSSSSSVPTSSPQPVPTSSPLLVAALSSLPAAMLPADTYPVSSVFLDRPAPGVL